MPTVVEDVLAVVTDAIGSLDAADAAIKDARGKLVDLQSATQLVDQQENPPAPAPAPAAEPAPAPAAADSTPPADATPPADDAAPATDPMGAPTA